MTSVLDRLGRLDWEGDFRGTAAASQAALRELVTTPGELQALIYGVEHRPDLMAKCERLKLDDKIVLYEALEDRGFRVRLHVSKNEHREIPHNHRFSITTFIVRGVYYHKLYVADAPLDEGLTAADVRPVFVRDEREGACYTMHHTVIESNTTAPGTMSLLLRGPTMKRRAVAVERTSDRMFFKYGEVDEPAETRENVAMSMADYLAIRARVDELMGWEPLVPAPA